jgi:hypothetical protein
LRYEIWNFGSTRVFPFKDRSVEIEQENGIYTEDAEMVEALSKFPLISVKELTSLKDLPMKDLNKKAGKAGINPFGMRKTELVAKLREVEQNG